MEWHNILIGVLGAMGGIGGLISIYMAKSNKTKIDIGNMQQMLDEAHKMYDEVKSEKNEYKQEFFEYRDKTNQYIEEFKKRFNSIENKMDDFERTILLAYRCQFPENIKDCPVIKRYEESKSEKSDSDK